MKLQQAVDLYIQHKRSLGMQCKTMARLLRAFCKAMGGVSTDEVSEQGVNTFIFGSGPVTTNLHSKFSALRGFYR